MRVSRVIQVFVCFSLAVGCISPGRRTAAPLTAASEATIDTTAGVIRVVLHVVNAIRQGGRINTIKVSSGWPIDASS